LALRVGTAVPSIASYDTPTAPSWVARHNAKAVIAGCCRRSWRLNWGRLGKRGK
jgi:hypothetical protein